MNMNVSGNRELSFFDRIRLTEGPDKLISLFDNSVKHMLLDIVDLINEQNLHFCSLFVLKPIIESNNCIDFLCPRNQEAINAINKILMKRTYSNGNKFIESRDINYSTLKWIFETGCMDDGLNNRYDEVLDKAALLLIKRYNDKSVLDTIINMIFNRNRKGLYIYDLVWGLFEAKNPHILINIANRLLSVHKEDIRLAEKLLSFIPDISTKKGKYRKYSYVLNWINENISFLYYTGQSFQETPTPKQYIVSLEDKYMCGYQDNSGAQSHIYLLERFRAQDIDTQEILSKCSFITYRINPYFWNKWLHNPIEEQIIFAKRMYGGMS